jgi:hypothetical protein
VEAKRLYEKAVGDIPTETSVEDLSGETPSGEERS